MGRKVTVKNNVELNKMRIAGRFAAEVMDYVTPFIKAGVSTLEIDKLCHDYIVKHGHIPAPLNYKGFPKSVCTSINEVVCHGIPDAKRLLKDGDIMNLDITVIVDGYHGDHSRMFLIGQVSDEARKLVDVTYEAMMAGIKTVKSGSYLSDIGKAIEAVARKHGYGIVEDFCGHGIGRIFHEDPQVLHYDAGDSRFDMRLKKGMTFTIEPMINIGSPGTEVLDDGWTAVTVDGKLSAQFEHTIAVTDNGYEILTKSPKGWHKPPYSGA
ncbi:MAG: type I methionyl aminopeptidase [Proteobacteria bacterium]|nr:type I methionyl aminopeptidase [Pseudomonadota bacterium]